MMERYSTSQISANEYNKEVEKMMKLLLLVMYSALVTSSQQETPAQQQTTIFKEKSKGSSHVLTTASGAPVDTRDKSTLNQNLILNKNFMDSLSHVVRENIPLRPVHPKGAGAFGYFVTTHDVTDICKAEFLSEIGKKTPLVTRLSMLVTEPGGSDLTREARGCAWKFYTKEGNFDMVGFNTPMFTIRNPSLFPSQVHVTKRNPATGLKDQNMFWDFVTLNPPVLFFFLYIFSDNGIPDGYRNMPCYSIHTYQLYNRFGKSNFCRFHFKPEGGLKNLNSSEAFRLGAMNPDYSATDLYNTIAEKKYPSWIVYLQCLTEEDVKKATFDPFDLTKILPTDIYPLRQAGRIVLDRNPQNYYAQVEQQAMCPANLVPGIYPSPDKVFESRAFSYRDGQRYRLGTNFDQIPVNCPYRSQVYTYERDGVSPVGDNGRDAPNYRPNSFDHLQEYIDKNRPLRKIIHEAEPDNFDQMRHFYAQKAQDERSRLVENILATLSLVHKDLQERAVKIFNKIHKDLGKRVSKGLKSSNS